MKYIVLVILDVAVLHSNVPLIAFFKDMSRLIRKPTICICENKGADQLRGNREADQRLCFRRCTDSKIPLLLISKISSVYPFSVTVQADLCRTCSETTLMVFPRGGSIMSVLVVVHGISTLLTITWYCIHTNKLMIGDTHCNLERSCG